MRKRGTRQDLVQELRTDAEAWHHLCKDKLSDAATEGAAGLEAGSFSVKVGHTVYEVDEGSDGGHTAR